MPPTNDALPKLKSALATARTQSESYLSGSALPSGKDVAAIAEAEPQNWWDSLTPEETFLLFEASPQTAGRAPLEVRAKAMCGGVEKISAEWWGTPQSVDNDLSRRAVALGKPVGACLARLFDSTDRLKYMDGESRHDAKEHGWTVADLAAALAARIVGTSYDAVAPAAERATARAALRAKL